ncbi:MAG TPA: hypothetical protein VHV80_01970 [Steroidobacteraceae bacterium]|jgi:hypothetical protein|nr:hypothetical protein [Steroidobacteraceae bacterium]
MKPHGLVAFLADLAIHLLVACVVAFLVFAVLRAVRPMGAIEHHLAATIARAGFGS